MFKLPLASLCCRFSVQQSHTITYKLAILNQEIARQRIAHWSNLTILSKSSGERWQWYIRMSRDNLPSKSSAIITHYMNIIFLVFFLLSKIELDLRQSFFIIRSFFFSNFILSKYHVVLFSFFIKIIQSQLN